MTTFTNKLDTLSDNFQSELDKLHKAIRDEIEEYVKQELENRGIPKNSISFKLRYNEYFSTLDLSECHIIKEYLPKMVKIIRQLETLDYKVKQAFEIPLTFTY